MKKNYLNYWLITALIAAVVLVCSTYIILHTNLSTNPRRVIMPATVLKKADGSKKETAELAKETAGSTPELHALTAESVESIRTEQSQTSAQPQPVHHEKSQQESSTEKVEQSSEEKPASAVSESVQATTDTTTAESETEASSPFGDAIALGEIGVAFPSLDESEIFEAAESGAATETDMSEQTEEADQSTDSESAESTENTENTENAEHTEHTIKPEVSESAADGATLVTEAAGDDNTTESLENMPRFSENQLATCNTLE